jgi:hypothetical protein
VVRRCPTAAQRTGLTTGARLSAGPPLPPSFGECSGGDGTGCPMHAVLWTRSGAIRDLGTLSGDALSAASKINFFGPVIGSSGNSLVFDYQGGPPEVIGRPFVWCERRGMRDLNTLIPTNSGWVLNSVADINNWGQIVGRGTRNGQPRGFLLTLLCNLVRIAADPRYSLVSDPSGRCRPAHSDFIQFGSGILDGHVALRSVRDADRIASPMEMFC